MGIYQFSTIVPVDWPPYDLVGVRVRATVNGITDNYHVWQASVADPALVQNAALAAQAIVALKLNLNRLLARLSATPANGGSPGFGIIGPAPGGLLAIGHTVRIVYPNFAWNGLIGQITGYAANSEYLVRVNSGRTIGVPSNRVVPY